MERRLEEQVWQRAEFRCEYCHFPAEFAEYPFHVDHIIASKHRGETEAGNLALACFYCNTSKGPNIAGIDPDTGDVTPLFNPRLDLWGEHFEWSGSNLTGLSPKGRTTIEVLNINEPDAVTVRRFLMSEDVYPR